MSIPDFQTIMNQLARYSNDQKEHYIRDTANDLAGFFSLTDEEKNKKQPSGVDKIFDNRIGWAKFYLKKAGFLEYTRRGYFKITQRGLDLLSEKPDRLDVKYLSRDPEFKKFHLGIKDDGDVNEEFVQDEQTPEDAMEKSYSALRRELADELLDKVKTNSSQFFEKLVVDLLIKMGYGGTHKDAGEAIGKSGDEGIDGIIKEDRLGLDAIYIQAKRWDKNSVGRPEIQQFVGALQGKRAKKGVFITTTEFTPDAVRYAGNIDCKVVLINGEQLAQLMVEYNLGVSLKKAYEIKEMDTDYFDE